MFASISFLPPIPFARRTIAAGATEGPIHGSVSAADVVAAVRDFGITLEESVVGGMGFAEGQPGVEKGRVKATGVYDCESRLPHYRQSGGSARLGHMVADSSRGLFATDPLLRSRGAVQDAGRDGDPQGGRVAGTVTCLQLSLSVFTTEVCTKRSASASGRKRTGGSGCWAWDGLRHGRAAVPAAGREI